MDINYFFSGPKSKNSDLKMGSGGFSQKMKAILQHATAEKRAGDGMFFFFNFKSSYLSFGLKSRFDFDSPSVTWNAE